MLLFEHCAMMFIYVIAVYVSSDPSTYIVRIRFAFKTGCDKAAARLASLHHKTGGHPSR
jgi:hypothetical protein